MDSQDRPTIADLEVYGLSLWMITTLEEWCGFIYVDQLETVDEAYLKKVDGFGPASIENLRTALRNYVNGTVVKTPEQCRICDD
jgi:hypothetical protein